MGKEMLLPYIVVVLFGLSYFVVAGSLTSDETSQIRVVLGLGQGVGNPIDLCYTVMMVILAPIIIFWIHLTGSKKIPMFQY